MIPNIKLLTEEITTVNHPSKTYKIICRQDYLDTGIQAFSMSSEVDATDRINGYVDGLESVMQAVYLILSTERYKFIIYSWDYGVELIDLFGQPMPYVRAELPNRIKDALTQDNRIEDVIDFQFEQHRKRLHVTFTVVTKVGNISTALEVEV